MRVGSGLNLLLFTLHILDLNNNSPVDGFFGSRIHETVYLRIMDHETGCRMREGMDAYRRYILRHACNRSNLTSDTLAYSEAGAKVTKSGGSEVRNHGGSEPRRLAGLEARKLGN